MKHYIPLLALIFSVAVGLGAATVPDQDTTIRRTYDSVAGETIGIPENPDGRVLVRIQDRTPLTKVNVFLNGELEETEPVAIYFYASEYQWVADGREFEIDGNNAFRVTVVDRIRLD